MESVQLTQTRDRTEIALHGALDVAHANIGRERLDKALRRGRPIVVRSSDLARVDAAGMQLLVAFCLAARKRDLEIQWPAPEESLLQAARLLGVVDMLDLPQSGDSRDAR